ncbi:MAG: redoxin domain-containing protein [Acidobacteriota bacterium]
MANDNFVNERLAALKGDDSFQPNAARARMLLHERRGTAARPRRWMWNTAGAAAVLFVVIAMHTPRVSAMNGGHPFASVHEFFSSFHSAVYSQYAAVLRVFRGSTEEAPDFVLVDERGTSRRLSAHRGKVVLLNFWATWCAPCKAEIPWFMDLQKTYGDDLAVLGVSMDEEGWSAVRPFMEQRGMNYPVMLDGAGLPDLYRKIESLPTTFLIDREGNIVGKHEALATKALYEDWVKKAF